MIKIRFAATLAFVLAALAVGACAFCPQSLASEPSSDIARELQPFVDHHVLAGAVTLVASPDKVLSLDAVGFADIAAQKPMQPDCLFWIASMSKPIAATALMMLVDEGKVRVDDPVEKYLPEFKGQMLSAGSDKGRAVLKKPAHPITVKEILSHTSGLPFMSPAEHTIDGLPLAEAVRSYAAGPLQFEPGSKYAYSNAGINTAGRIIEVVSAVPYEEFLASRLLKPLGMKDTTFQPNAGQLRRLAKSYKPNAAQNGLEETTIGQLSHPLSCKHYPCPAGGLFSTAADVSLFCRMILGGGAYQGRRYVSEAAVRQMTATQIGRLGGYGFGWGTSRETRGPGDPVIVGPCGHGGAYATDMWIDPQRRLIYVYMVQHAGYPGPEGGKILPTFRKAAEKAFAK